VGRGQPSAREAVLNTAKAHILAALLAGAACLTPPALALAQPVAPAPKGASSPRELYKSGEAKFKAGDYAGALVDFQAVDSLKPTPQAARYIGLSQDKLGHYQEAVAAYERFLGNVPPKLTKEGDEIHKRLDEIKAMPGKVHIETAPAGATVAIDGKPQGQPSPLDVDLPAGRHSLHVSAEGREAQDRDLDVAYASRTDVSLQLAPAAAPAPSSPPIVAEAPPPPPTTPAPPPPPPEAHSRLPAYITGGLAIVGAGIGTVFGVMALNDQSNFNKTPTSATADTGENHALICDMAFGVAITLGVTSAVLFLTNDEAPPKAAGQSRPVKIAAPKKNAVTITPSPIVTPHGAGAGALLRF
jgi:hypothetical protein